MRRARRPWNHNIHYRPLILNEIPASCQQVLDVGCGAGTLARELSARVPRVTGIDAGRQQACSKTMPGRPGGGP